MSITSRERMLLHWIIKRYDHAAGATAISPADLEKEAGLSPAEFAEVVASLVREGYLQETALDEDDGTWRLVPSDRGVLSAMGLAD
jgi:DNA-binding IclR family transcriptional regulator